MLRIALAQINTIVGNLTGNTDKILSHLDRARELGVDLIAFPELAVPGYPPEDLLLKPSFVEANLQALDRIARATDGLTAIVGYVDRDDDIYNAAAVLDRGQIAGIYHKTYLPNYASLTRNATFVPASARSSFSSGKPRSASTFARTSGTPPARPRPRPWPVRSWWSTSPPRPITPARASRASACSPPAPPTMSS
jgi:predicted amidohydrolase